MICAIVLAAGRSERMGTQKLLLPLGGQPVIVRVIDELLCSQLDEILVVVGRDVAKLRAALDKRAVQFVENPNHASEMLESLRCGLRNLPPGCEAVMMVLGDQPGISRALVNEMILRLRDGRAEIVLPSHNGHRGHPVLFRSKFCGEVLACHDQTGLRGLLDGHPDKIRCLAVSNADTLADMDTPADYRQQARRLAGPVTPEPFLPRGQSG